MVKITKFAGDVTKETKARQKARIFHFAELCRRAAFSWGNEKRIGKDGKISCRIFLSPVAIRMFSVKIRA